MANRALDIRPLAEGDEAAFLAGLDEWRGEGLDWHTFVWKEGMTHAEHLRILENESRGIELPEGRVPHTSLYGFLDGEIVGRCSVRHRLNENLKKRGGHIGYGVAPRFRKRGFGTQLLRAGLALLKQIGETKALLTCARSNSASIRMIEGVGGVLTREWFDEGMNEVSLHYWIDLEKPAAEGSEVDNDESRP